MIQHFNGFINSNSIGNVSACQDGILINFSSHFYGVLSLIL